MGETIIREVTKHICTFSRPFHRFGLVPIGGRSTAVKLVDGTVWVLASTPLDDETKRKLNEMGPVKYIVSADIVHHLFLGEFKKEYPDAKLIAFEEVKQKAANKGLTFDGLWDKDPPGTKYGFEDSIKACYFSGFKNKDVAFYHPESKTMIEADLLFNLPSTEQHSQSKTPMFKMFNLSPHSWTHRKIVWSLGIDKEAMQRDAKTVASWDFERIIPCHGDVIEKDGNKTWRAAYKNFLD